MHISSGLNTVYSLYGQQKGNNIKSTVSAQNSRKMRTTVQTNQTTKTEKNAMGYSRTEETYAVYTKEGLTQNTVTEEDDRQNVWEMAFGTGKNSEESENFAELVRGDADVIQRLLNQLWKEGKIIPITNEIISLPEEKDMVQGFDFKV